MSFSPSRSVGATLEDAQAFMPGEMMSLPPSELVDTALDGV